jgi:acyl dehydratase
MTMKTDSGAAGARGSAAAVVNPADVAPLARGRTWEELPAGFAYRTGARTITESDLVGFIGVSGFVGPTFLDARRGPHAAYSGRVVPGLLTLTFAEALVVQTTVLNGTGIAFLSLEMNVVAPVFVGDTIEVVVEITESRPTSKGGRGFVSSTNTVFNQHGAVVLSYAPNRLQRGKSDDLLTADGHNSTLLE